MLLELSSGQCSIARATGHIPVFQQVECSGHCNKGDNRGECGCLCKRASERTDRVGLLGDSKAVFV